MPGHDQRPVYPSGVDDRISNFITGIVASGGRVPRSGVEARARDAGYPPGSWTGYLRGFLTYDGADVVLSPAMYRFIALVLAAVWRTWDSRKLDELWQEATRSNSEAE